MSDPYQGQSTDKNVPAVSGESTAEGGVGVSGSCVGSGGSGVSGSCDTGHGVHGESIGSRGVYGKSNGFHGVYGLSNTNVGVAGESTSGDGVFGVSHGDGNTSGVSGHADHDGNGVAGRSAGGRGVAGFSETWQGVYGSSNSQAGVVGESNSFHAVFGMSHDIHNGGVFGTNNAGGFGVIGTCDAGTGVEGDSKTGIGVHAKGGKLAGLFEGDVEVTGDLRMTNADCAEDFDIADADLIEPGTVMVLGDEGSLYRSQQAYDKRVAGVVSGAGDYRPGIILDKQQSSHNRQPIALLGKVFCKVDARFGAISVGDLLTTSLTPGYAMKASDPLTAFGAVIGKALRPLKEGQALIPILIALQ